MGVELAKIMKDRMESLHLTYEKAAGLSGISRTYIAKILQGIRNPDDQVTLRIADVLQMDRKELLFITHRDKAPEEAKVYFGPKLKEVRVFDPGRAFRESMPDPEYVVEDKFSKKFAELAKQTFPWAKKAIEKENDFPGQFREAWNQVSIFISKGGPREGAPEERKEEKLHREFEKLFDQMEAQRKRELAKKEVIRLEIPLLTDEDPKDPQLLFGGRKKKEEKETKLWSLTFEKTIDTVPFSYEMRDESMTPLIQKKDTVISFTEAIGVETLIGKIVIAKIKGLGIVIRHYNRKEKNTILTALNPSFPPHILSRGEIDWLYPVNGIYRRIVD